MKKPDHMKTAFYFIEVGYNDSMPTSHHNVIHMMDFTESQPVFPKQNELVLVGDHWYTIKSITHEYLQEYQKLFILVTRFAHKHQLIQVVEKYEKSLSVK